jgi:hypothetical protein
MSNIHNPQCVRTAWGKATVKKYTRMRRLQTYVAPSKNRTDERRTYILTQPFATAHRIFYPQPMVQHPRALKKTTALRTARGKSTVKKYMNAQAANIRSAQQKSYRREEKIYLYPTLCYGASYLFSTAYGTKSTDTKKRLLHCAPPETNSYSKKIHECEGYKRTYHV